MMRRRFITTGIAVIAATAVVAGARARERALIAVRVPEIRLPGALVVASKPSLKEIVDLIVGEQGSSEERSRIAAMLRKRTSDAQLADRIARDLVDEGKKANIAATLLAGILLVENPELEPHARSAVGARGLMQVMPFHAGKWGCASADLFDIEANICHGARILADNLRHSRNLPTALLKYNGCVRGTNTPDCHRYARIVYRNAQRSAVGLDGKVTASTPFSTKTE
ncbi:MAG TPA: lytic transglycosylase domain-containing protein [Gemmatimonadaceae bacterium]|nr:lytic transglycosylase domain-containing protein [Gemmatimonadaceae bacterium]